MNRCAIIGWFVVCLWAVSAGATITVGSWSPIFQGIDFAAGEADTNEVRQQKVRVLRMDLNNPAVQFFSTPKGGPLETIGQTTTTFVKTYGVAVGINANFFSPVSTIPDDPRDLSGLAISQSNLVSAFEAGRPAVLITRSNQVSFASSAPANYTNVWTAVSGSDRVLINGVAQLASCTTSFCLENPRSAVGLSTNGRYFYMMVIDGRQAGWSDGATLYETGQWLARFGAYNGLNLDGGGSTALAKLESGNAVLLNKPSGGVQRVNGNHLGVFAPPIVPVIATHPQNQSTNVGSGVTFTVDAGGTTPLQYRWRFNGTNIASATTTKLTLSNLQASQAGNYSVAISNLAGVTISSNALLTVAAPYVISNVAVRPRPSSALISWVSSPAMTSQVEYGVATNFDLITTRETVARTNHQVLLVGLMPNTNYAFRIRSFIGATQTVSETFNFSTDLNLIVDNPQATYAGTWTLATLSLDKFGADYQYATATTNAVASAQATYTPSIVTPGKYDVSIWYPQGGNRTTNARVTVYGNGGSVTQGVDQTVGGGVWYLLATNVDFSEGTSGFAVIANNTGESNRVVMADAMRWSYVNAQDAALDGNVPLWWSGHYFGSNVNASLDPDGDGYSTHDEYVAGTDPTNAASRLLMTSKRVGTLLRFDFSPVQGGRVYEMQRAMSMTGTWSDLPNTPVITGTNGVFVIGNPVTPGAVFYRLSVRLMP